MDEIRLINISHNGRKTIRLCVDDRDRTEYLLLVGVLQHLYQAVFTHPCFFAFKIQEKLGAQEVEHLLEANFPMSVDLKKLQPALSFP